mmetsp:Transcript_23777/g.38751  ORF Transcript_23777/g.38751 Transcript_23777/m.38751 type:complete len:331 (+) Transcript_23777:121-1113(+)
MTVIVKPEESAAYELPLKDCASCTLTPPGQKRNGFRGRRSQKLPDVVNLVTTFPGGCQASNISVCSERSLDDSLHLEDLRADDDSVGGYSIQNSILVSRRRKTALECIDDALDEVGFSDFDDLSLCSRSSSTISSKRKRLRFKPSRNEYFEPSPEPLTEEEIEESWWSVEDYDKAVSVTEKYIDDFPAQNVEPMQDLIRLVAFCYKLQDETMEDLKFAVALTPTVSRGFESEIIPPLKQSRKRHTRAVLDMAYRNPDDCEAIAESSRALSKPHQLLAKVYAQRDLSAAVAALSSPWKNKQKRSRSSSRRRRGRSLSSSSRRRGNDSSEQS